MNVWLQQIRFYSSALVVYAMTAAFAWYVLQPIHALAQSVPASNTVVQRAPIVPKKEAISGKPTRIVVPASEIDLQVEPGTYDQATREWTLSGYNAQFATFSSPANDLSGKTFIYGHNNNHVFGALRHNTPEVGATALIYTDNGHVFEYAFTDVKSVTPNDTQVLAFDGPPVLVIQTCTGSLDEWRTLYSFKFMKVIQ
jgi:LPXTG-site transpeptidase (sortase) family protein